MFESSEEKAEKAKALKKLMAKWLTVQGTERKAALLLEKNPEIRSPKIKSAAKNRKAS